MSGDKRQKARVDNDDEKKRSRSPASRPVPDANTDLSVQSSPSTPPTSPQDGNDDAFVFCSSVMMVLLFFGVRL